MLNSHCVTSAAVIVKFHDPTNDNFPFFFVFFVVVVFFFYFNYQQEKSEIG